MAPKRSRGEVLAGKANQLQATSAARPYLGQCDSGIDYLHDDIRDMPRKRQDPNCPGVYIEPTTADFQKWVKEPELTACAAQSQVRWVVHGYFG